MPTAHNRSGHCPVYKQERRPFGGQLPNGGKQFIIDRGNGNNGANGSPCYGLPDKLGLADVVMLQPPGEVGVFFLGHAGLDYMAAVGRVVSLGYGYHSFLCVVFRRGGLKKASCPFYYPHHQKSKIAKRFRKIFCGASRIAGFGEGTPQQDLPQGQNRRYADFGTVVESCSKKLPLSSTADFAAIRRGRLGLFPSI